VDLLLSGNLTGHPLAAAPGTPPERVQAFRSAFEAMRKDPAFLEDARRSGVMVGSITGAEITAAVAKVLATPPAILDRGRKILE
jgi:tripartite-type tricarboxylate transporter receptor subunit TctC